MLVMQDSVRDGMCVELIALSRAVQAVPPCAVSKELQEHVSNMAAMLMGPEIKWFDEEEARKRWRRS